MKVLVTGGAGFIGSNLAEELAKDNQVIILDDLSTGRGENISELVKNPNVKFIKGSILDLNLLRQVFEGIQYVFHQAALPSVSRSVEDPILVNEVNIHGTLNVLVAARDAKVAKVVFASSSSVYGDTLVLPKEESMPPNPRSPYALTKMAGEYYCHVFNQIYHLPTICLRYFNVYGPRQNPSSQYAAVIPKFITSLKQDKSPTIYGDGNHTRDFTFVKDVIQANIKAALSESTGTFNIGTGSNTTLNQLLHLLMLITGKNIKPIFQEARVGDVRDSLASIKKANAIGYRPQYSLEQGLRETIERY